MEPGPDLNITVGRGQSDWPYREIIAIAGGQLVNSHHCHHCNSQQTFQEFSASGAASGASALSSWHL